MATNVGGKDAFPTPLLHNETEIDAEKIAAYAGPGLTVREYTAVKIMAGMTSSYHLAFSENVLARMAIRRADALMKQLEKYPEGEVPDEEDIDDDDESSGGET